MMTSVLFKEKLACPVCLAEGMTQVAEAIRCVQCDRLYPVVNGIPHLIDPESQVKTRLDEFAYDDSTGEDVPDVLLQNWETLFGEFQARFGDVLELGCGGGYLTQALLHHFPFAAVHAVDISPIFLEMARKKIQAEQQHKAAFYLCDANFLPFAQHSFDVVIGRSVLHHFVDYEKILVHIATLLRPGGLAIFYEPVIQGKAKIAFMLQLMLMINKRFAEPVFDDEELQKIKRLHKHLVKALVVGDNREKLAQMEDKYIFDITKMRTTGLACGFSAVHYQNWQSKDGLFYIGLEQHLIALGIAREKVRQFSFLTRAYRENMMRLLPDEQFTPMGFFVFQK